MHKFGSRVIDALLIGVGLTDTLLVALYAVQWNMYTGSSLVEAIGFSVAITGGGIIFFEYAVYEALKKRRKLVYLLFFLWFVIAAYSMQMTVAGQYVGVMRETEKRNLENSLAINSTSTQTLLSEEINRLEKSVLTDKERIKAIDQTLLNVDTIEKAAEYRTTIQALRAERETISKRILNASTRTALLQDQKIALVSSTSGSIATYERKDVFQFYSDVLKITRTDLIQFWLAVFKGIVLDLVNILCFMFVLLRSQANEREDIRPANGNTDKDIRPVDYNSGEDSGLVGKGASNGEKDAVHRLAAYLYQAGGQGRNGTFIPAGRAKASLGIGEECYKDIVSKGLLRGLFRRSGGRIYHVAGYTEEEFLKELS